MRRTPVTPGVPPTGHVLADLWQDLRYAWRLTWRRPGIHCHRGADAGARHRREQRDLQSGGCRAAPDAPRRSARAARPDRTGYGARWHAEHLASPVRTPARRRERLLGHPRRAGRVHDGERRRSRGCHSIAAAGCFVERRHRRRCGSLTDRHRAGRLRGVFPGARHVRARRAGVHIGRRPHARRASGGSPEPQLLDAPAGRRSGNRRPHHHAGAPTLHDRRRHASRLLWRGNRSRARDLGADDDAPDAQPRSVAARRSKSRMVAGDRTPAARRHASTGRRRPHGAPRSTEGGSGLARWHAAAHRQAARRRRQSGVGAPPRAVLTAAAHPDGGRRRRAADCLRERGHDAAGAREHAAAGNRHSPGDRSGPPPARAAADDGGAAAGHDRRITGPLVVLVGKPDAAGDGRSPGPAARYRRHAGRTSARLQYARVVRRRDPVRACARAVRVARGHQRRNEADAWRALAACAFRRFWSLRRSRSRCR